MSVLPYYIAYVLPATVVLGVQLGGGFTFLTLFVVFCLVPLLDAVLGGDDRNPTPDEMAVLEARWSFRMVLYLYVPVQLGLIVWGASMVSKQHLSWLEIAGVTASVGIVAGGLGITIAHELAHKRTSLERSLGKLLLLSVSYMHFYIEHNIGHHTKVATPDDPATARFGESFYAFLPRTVIGSWRSAWNIEVQRLRRTGRVVVSLHNQMIWFAILPLLAAVSLGLALGWLACLFFVAQSAIAIILLEAVNYLEHYGLERKQLASGRYEKVSAAHSWNANHRLTNYLLFKLQRHADHHIHPVRRYQTLRHFPDSPQLPTGYAGMVLLAFVPPLWRRTIHPRLMAANAGGA